MIVYVSICQGKGDKGGRYQACGDCDPETEFEFDPGKPELCSCVGDNTPNSEGDGEDWQEGDKEGVLLLFGFFIVLKIYSDTSIVI